MGKCHLTKISTTPSWRRAYGRRHLRQVVGIRWPHQALYHTAAAARWTIFGHVLRTTPNTPALRSASLHFEIETSSHTKADWQTARIRARAAVCGRRGRHWGSDINRIRARAAVCGRRGRHWGSDSDRIRARATVCGRRGRHWGSDSDMIRARAAVCGRRGRHWGSDINTIRARAAVCGRRGRHWGSDIVIGFGRELQCAADVDALGLKAYTWMPYFDRVRT